MPIVKELDVCPHCLQKIYHDIIKYQTIVNQQHQDNQNKENESKSNDHAEEKDKGQGWGSFGGSQIVSREEVQKCLASLPYTLPICDYCKLHRNISIVKLPATSLTVQKPEEVPKQTEKSTKREQHTLKSK